MRMIATTASDLRAEIARRRVRVYRIAVRLGIHPSRVSLLINEKMPLTEDLAARVLRAIQDEAAAQ